MSAIWYAHKARFSEVSEKNKTSVSYTESLPREFYDRRFVYFNEMFTTRIELVKDDEDFTLCTLAKRFQLRHEYSRYSPIEKELLCDLYCVKRDEIELNFMFDTHLIDISLRAKTLTAQFAPYHYIVHKAACSAGCRLCIHLYVIDHHHCNTNRLTLSGLKYGGDGLLYWRSEGDTGYKIITDSCRALMVDEIITVCDRIRSIFGSQNTISYQFVGHSEHGLFTVSDGVKHNDFTVCIPFLNNEVDRLLLLQRLGYGFKTIKNKYGYDFKYDRSIGFVRALGFCSGRLRFMATVPYQEADITTTRRPKKIKLNLSDVSSEDSTTEC
jgi:hypothetical protein